jgi:hypothetical protein
MGLSINVALPSIEAEFGVDAIVPSWLPASFLLSDISGKL